MLSLLGSNGLWDYVQIVMSNCQNPLLGKVLGSIPPCIHERKHIGIQIQTQMGEGNPPDELIQKAR